jgi:hypothetical protein
MMSFFRKFLSGVLALSVIVGSASASAMSLDDGRYYFRYKGIGDGKLVDDPVVDDDSANKDITAFYVGGLALPFSEELPMKPQWQNDNWIVESPLPAGIAFDPNTRTFSGTPTSLGVSKVNLKGYDKNGVAVASALATFTIVNLPNSRETVDLYAHTGKFYNKSFDLPPGVAVQEWKEFASPPPGVTYNGRYVDGTPTKAGLYSILNIGYDYNGDAVYAYIGKMLVEDGPTFAWVEDDLRNVIRQSGCDYGYECARWIQRDLPTIKRAIANPVKVNYSFELETGDEIPNGLTFARQFPPSTAYYVNGFVFDFYDQVKMRMKAVDVDGTIGYSNWFKLGSAGPGEICKPQYGQSEVKLPGIVGQAFLNGGYRVASGINVSGGKFTVKQGDLPTGLSLDEDTGVISGVPQTEEVRTGIYIEATYPQNPAMEPIECGPYKFDIAPDAFDLRLVSNIPIGYHTGTQVDIKLEATGALLDGYAAEIVDTMSTIPPEVQLIKTGEKEWTLSGVLQTAGDFNVYIRLINGDGRPSPGVVLVPLVVREALDIGDIVNDTVDIQQFALAGVGNPLVDFDVENAIGRLDIQLDSEFSGVGVEYKSLVGGTIAAPGKYGPFVATVTDEIGATASTAPFYFNVLPRAGLAGETENPVKLTVNKNAAVRPFVVPVDPNQEPLVNSVYSLTYSISPTQLPDGMVFNPGTGILSGTPRSLGSYPGFTITAQEVGAAGGTSLTSDTFTIEVEEPPAIGTLRLPRLDGNKNGVFVTSADPRAALTVAKDSIVGEIDEVKYLSFTPTVPGLTLNTVTGTLEGIPTSEFNGDVSIAIEDSAGRPGELKFTVKVWPYPALTAPVAFEIPRLSKAEDFDVKIVPNSGFYAGQLFKLAPSSQQSLPSGMTLDAATGEVRGQSSMPVGTVRNVVVRAISNANGIAVDLPVSFKIVQQRPMELNIPSDTVALFKINEVTRAVSVTPSISIPSYLAGSYAKPVTWSLVDQPSWLAINPVTGLLTARANPSSLGEWTVTVRASDVEGSAITATLKVKVTLDGFVQSLTGGESITLRQEETFRFKEQVLRNVVPPYSFSSSMGQSETLTFNSLTGVTEGKLTSPGVAQWGLQVQDRDGRTFSTSLIFTANVVGPLQFVPAPLSPVEAVQYDPSRPVTISFPGAIRNIGTVSYGLDGNLPGTLYYKSTNAAGLSVYQHFPASGGVQTVVQGASETVVETEARLANDRLIFDTATLTLQGVPSQAGRFEVYVVAHDDHQEYGYKANPDDVTRFSHNNASHGPYVINVAPKPQMQLVASTGIPRHVIVNNQDANMKVSAQNVGYAVSNWNVSGVSNLPPGVTYQMVDDGVQFSGKPTLLGDFTGITVTATDKLGQTASLNVSFKIIPSPDAIVLNVFEIKSKVGMPVRMEPPFASDVLSTENTYGNLYFATQNGEANGVTIDRATGSLTYSASQVGDYVFNLSVTDDTDRITSKPVTVKVMPPLRVLVPTVVYFEQGVNSQTAVSTDYAIGKVTYEKGVGAWPEGLIVDKDTGAISGRTSAAIADYRELTIVGKDAAGDVQSSNTFQITVEPIRAKPVIDNIVNNRLLLGSVGAAVTPFKPTVTDNVYRQPWNYAGTRYSISRDISQYGLNFDTTTGQITGVANQVVALDNMVIKVASERGDEAETAPFFLGVAPEGPISQDPTEPVDVIVRSNSALALEPKFVNAYGVKTFAIAGVTYPLGYYPINVNAQTGVTTITIPDGVSSAQFSQLSIRVTDVFGRTGIFTYNVRISGALKLQYTGLTINSSRPVNSLKLVDVTGLSGTAQYEATGLPAGLSIDPQTGLVSGNGSGSGVGVSSVTVKVTDSFDGATASSTFQLNTGSMVKARYWYLRFFDIWVQEFALYDQSGVNVARNATNYYAAIGYWGPDSEKYKMFDDDLVTQTPIAASDAVSGAFVTVDFGPDEANWPTVASVGYSISTYGGRPVIVGYDNRFVPAEWVAGTSGAIAVRHDYYTQQPGSVTVRSIGGN